MADTPKIRRLDWYRVPLAPDVLKELNERSDLLAFLQAGGHLALLVGTGSLAFYAQAHWHWLFLIPILFLHGTVFAFMINAVHELGHGTVFRTRWLNEVFVHIFAFLGWINHLKFDASHVLHHRYTLHPPDDLEVTLPARIALKDILKTGFVNPWGIKWVLRDNWRLARGRFQGEWELHTLPESQPRKRQAIVNWSRAILIGHALILAASIWFQLWLLPVLVTFGAFYGHLLQSLCNNVQHIGLMDKVLDFRLCCRTIYLNPVVRFLYWHMNYHTEHHMYAAVPCYKLGRLHRAIRHEMPPVKGLLGAWREIFEILRRQQADPSYQYAQPLPSQAPQVAADRPADADPQMVTAAAP